MSYGDQPRDDDARDELVRLARRLGAPGAGLVMLAEGNVSMRAGAGRLIVKASGAAMGDACRDDFVTLEIAPLLALVRRGSGDDDDVARVLQSALVDRAGRRPSVESFFHAVALTRPGVVAVAHAHPAALNSLLCSDRADRLVAGALFPDQIVVLGRHQLLLPYVDPGVGLAAAAAHALRDFRDRRGCEARVIYVRNHGVFALGRSAEDAAQIVEMAEKTARILCGALAVGEPVYLDEREADRIGGRPDEHYRQEQLAAHGRESR